VPSTYRNISFATAASVGLVMREGKDVTVRELPTKEVLNRVTVLERPIERFVFLPQRLNDVFAQIAETMWVVRGRNDIGWLKDYLSRAQEYSDDGATWRAGYGPRLRQWHGTVDQLDEVRKLLLEDPLSRRAVMSLYDPEADFVDSKDIPCNNWLSWIIRDGRLHLNVAIRSNDAMWGFSGVNAFEWSVLHEMMAHWTNTRVGSVTYFATSFHLYAKHYERANKIVDHFHGLTPYDFGIESVAFNTSWEQFGEALGDWFIAEERIRHDPEAPLVTNLATRDPFFANGLNLRRPQRVALSIARANAPMASCARARR
jgi:thymidylate synthase